MKTACFRFEASPIIGAGHAIRSSVIADALVDADWVCKVVTSAETYDFIKALSRFERIDPKYFEQNPVKCDLLVVDNYNLDAEYESKFRKHAHKILVIDDLANRQHDCDILIDQACGRIQADYQSYVPRDCILLLGNYYAMLRKGFKQLRPQALEKRIKTTTIEKILVSLGGSDQHNFTLSALQMIKQANFNGKIDIALGFAAPHLDSINDYIATLANDCQIHIDADMPRLMYEADLSIGAAGSTVWERSCLGLPSIIMQTASNQTFFLSQIASFNKILTNHLDVKSFNQAFESIDKDYSSYALQAYNKIDACGIDRIISHI